MWQRINQDEFLLWILLIALMGVMGIALVFGLMMTWRRFNERTALRPREDEPARSKPKPEGSDDIWQASGKRYVDDTLPPKRKEPPRQSPDALDEDDEPDEPFTSPDDTGETDLDDDDEDEDDDRDNDDEDEDGGAFKV